MKLTPHEEKILLLVKSHPDIITDSKEREKLAKKHGLSEKTLRNRIGDLKKYGIIGDSQKDVFTEDLFSSKNERPIRSSMVFLFSSLFISEILVTVPCCTAFNWLSPALATSNMSITRDLLIFLLSI